MKQRFLLIFALSLLFVGNAEAQELANFSMGRNRPLISPEVTADSVTFRLPGNYATQVQLYGSWLTDFRSLIPMQKGAGGVWSVTIPAPAPEIYTYNFIVDGVSVNDPANILVQRDGTRFLSMLLIDGELTANYREAQQHGNVSAVWYDSPTLGISRRMTVYTPYGYDKSKQKYPVLYLLHGAGGDEEAWSSMGRTAQIMDNLIEQGKATPMIVVMPNGNPTQYASRTLCIPEQQVNFRDPAFANAYVKSIVNDIVPYIESHYRTIAKPDGRAIAGLSMGGGHTIAAANLFPGFFQYICPLSMGMMAQNEEQSAEIDKSLQGLKKAGYKLYWLACGDSDFLFNSAKGLDAALTKNGLEHTFYVTSGGHTWSNWRIYLNTFAPLLFK